MSHYLKGRVPDADKLVQIRSLTGCDLNWLLTGEVTEQRPAASINLADKLRTIAREQAKVIFSDVQLAGANAEAEAERILTEYLTARGLREMGLIVTESDVMRPEDLRRARRFTFVRERGPTFEDLVRRVINEELAGDSVTLATGERITVPHLGTVDGGETIQEEPKRRKTA